MADSGGWQNVVLPSLLGSPGDALQSRIASKQHAYDQQFEADQAEKLRKEREQQQYSLVNLNKLNQATDADKMLLGDRYANDVTAKQLRAVYDELIGKVGTTDPVTFDYMLHNKTDEFSNWHNQFKQDFDYSKQRVDDILKQNTNLSPEQAKEVVRGELDSKYFKKDENGNFIRKSPEEVDTNKDPTAILNDPRMQGNIAIGGQDVLKKYIQSQKLRTEDYSKYSSNKGFVNANSYDIGVSGLQELSHDEHGSPVLKMKTEDFHMGDGVNLKMIPKATFDEMMNVPEVASAINKMWNPVAAKIEEQFAQSGGAIDRQSEEMLKRDFIRKQIEDNNLDLSFITEKQKNVIPNPPSININVGQQQRNQANELIDGIVGSIRSGDETKLKQLTSYFKRGNTPFKLEEAFFVPGSNKKKVAIQYYIVDDKGKKKFKEKYFQADDPYLRDKIIAEYQQDMGSTVPVETLPYEQYLPNVQQPTGQSPKQNNSNKKKIPNF